MRYFLLFLLFFALEELNCQKLITDDSVILKKGFYTHFYEFKYNKPSLPFDYTIDSCLVRYGGSKFDGTHKYYAISVKDDQDKFLREVYGFCDGKDIYISLGKGLISSKISFEKLIFKGRYCLNNIIVDKGRIPVPLPGGGMMLVTTSHQLATYLIDMNNGESLIFDEKRLKRILQTDKELFDRFSAEANSKEKLNEYLINYSIKHKNEISYNEQDVTPGEINEILKKAPTDSTFDIYYGRIIEKLKKMRDITNIELWQSKYGNGNYKFIGLAAIHNLSFNATYNYKIGYWRYFYRNGEIQTEIIYDLNENKITEREFEQKN